MLIKMPTRQRPDRFRHALELLVKHAVRPRDLHFLFTFDKNDPNLEENEMIAAHVCVGSKRPIAFDYTAPPGQSTSKINAVNRDLPEFSLPWQTVVVASDDMHATPAWDQWIIEAMAKFYPDGDGCLWFADGFQKDICTIPCMGRAYFDRFGYIYNPAYQSVFVDDEQTHVGVKLGKLTKIDHVLFRHDHPAWNSSLKPDALYQRNEAPAVWKHDETIYRARHAAGFP